MNKCFITKLPSSVDNDNLPVLGQLRINWLKQDALSDNSQRGLWLSTNDSITVKVSGAHFTDKTLTSNLGNTKTITAADGLVALYVSNDADAILTIDNKYSLTALKTEAVIESPLQHSISFDIDDIRYCTNLTSLVLHSPQVTGDIDAVSKLTNLTSLNLSGTKVNGDIKAISGLTKLTVLLIYSSQVSGDISAVSNLTNLDMLNAGNTSVSGDISAVSNLTNLNTLAIDNTSVSGNINAVSNLTNLALLYLGGTQVNGDINAVSNLTNLTTLSLSNTNITGNISAISNLTNLTSLNLSDTNITGNISAISGLTKLTLINLNFLPLSGKIDSLANLTKLSSLSGLAGLSLTGDMSKIPAGVNFITQGKRKVTTNFTWTAKGRQNATLLAMGGGVPFDTASMDNMFIDQATCTFKPSAESWTRTISVNGTRTSASDAAVATLQNMGVTITGVTKQA